MLYAGQLRRRSTQDLKKQSVVAQQRPMTPGTILRSMDSACRVQASDADWPSPRPASTSCLASHV